MEVIEILHTEGTMTPRGGPRIGSGRKPRPNIGRHNIIVSDEVWQWLRSQPEMTAGQVVEKLVKAEIAKGRIGG